MPIPRAIGRRHEIIDLGDALRASVTTMLASTTNDTIEQNPREGCALMTSSKLAIFDDRPASARPFPISSRAIGSGLPEL
jgi:hypothetical protein